MGAALHDGLLPFQVEAFVYTSRQGKITTAGEKKTQVLRAQFFIKVHVSTSGHIEVKSVGGLTKYFKLNGVIFAKGGDKGSKFLDGSPTHLTTDFTTL